MKKISHCKFGAICFLFGMIASGALIIAGCKKDESNKQANKSDTELSNRDSEPSASKETEDDDQTLLERTGGMLRKATDTSMKAAGNAGTWMKDTVQDSYEGGKAATVSAGNAIREMFQQAKEAGTTTTNNVVDFVKEDIAKLGSWRYASRTVTNENPNDVVTMLNQMGAQKWECFWVDKQATQTTLYFKKSPRSYVNGIPFRDLIRYLPELGQGNE